MSHSEPFITLVNEAKKNIQQMSVEEAAALLEKAPDTVLIDVREDSEYAAGHLPHAIHLSKGIIELNIGAIVPDNHTTVLLYCGGGFRSALSAYNLKKMGYNNVISMDGGFRGWVQSGLPVEV